MKVKVNYGFLIVLCLTAASVWGDSLELKNGSLIKGKFVGGTETEISFQVGSSVQKYNVADIVSLKFDSVSSADEMPVRPSESKGREQGSVKTPGELTIPTGTRISVRTIDSVDSSKNHVGDRFQASLEEPLIVGGDVVVAKGADVYGRLSESKELWDVHRKIAATAGIDGDRREWADNTHRNWRV